MSINIFIKKKERKKSVTLVSKLNFQQFCDSKWPVFLNLPERPSLQVTISPIMKPHQKAAVPKSGTGTQGWGCKDASSGMWDAGTRDVGRGDVTWGT